MGSDEGTEWHRLRLKNGHDINTLRSILANILNEFPNYNWDHSTIQPFQQLVDQAWTASGLPSNTPGEFADILRS
jgi:hypothetical protein